MSVARTALRLAACMALTNGYRAPFPTLAADRVYDSRLDPIQGLGDTDLVPTIIVTAEDHQGENLSPTSGGPPFGNLVDLTFDMSIGIGGSKDGVPLMIQSEPELEAALDYMEEWVKWALFLDPHNVWGARFRQIAIQTSGWKSTVFREREANVRLSARQCVANVRLHAGPDLNLNAGIPAPLGPLLNDIIADGGPFAETALAIQDVLGPVPAGAPLPLLTKVRLIETDHAVTDDEHEGPAGLRHAGVAQANLED